MCWAIPEHTRSSISSDAQCPGLQAGARSPLRWVSSWLSLDFSDSQGLQESNIRIGEFSDRLSEYAAFPYCHVFLAILLSTQNMLLFLGS